MYCKNCGQPVKIGVKFCKNCGQELTLSKRNIAIEGFKNWLTSHRTGILIAIAVIILLVLISYLPGSSSNNSSQQTIGTGNSQSVVDILCDNGYSGSGVIFTTNGTILTNNHVVTGSKSCKITIPDPTTGQISYIYNAIPVIIPKLSKQFDVATLTINGSYTDSNGKSWGPYPTSFNAFTLPSSCDTKTSSQLNDSIRIYGYPVTSGGYNLTVTDGIISSFADNGDILTSAKVDSGNSGGLAVDQNGCWLGIPSAVVSGNYQNLGVIIPGSVVENFISDAPFKAEPVTVNSETNTAPESALAPSETNDQICQDSFGTYSEYSGKIGNNGSPLCNCQNGYSWDGTGKSCASQLTLEQWCTNQYGSRSYSYQESGKAVCGCIEGYSFNTDQTSCVSYDQSCKNDYGEFSTWSGSLNDQGGPTCSCQSGYVWNSDQTACILDTSCPTFSTYNYSSGKCECDTGYALVGNACESDYTYCQNKEGYGASYDPSTNSCTCQSGYIYYGSQCVSGYSYCSQRWGFGAQYDYSTNQCECRYGYTVNSSGTGCVYSPSGY